MAEYHCKVAREQNKFLKAEGKMRSGRVLSVSKQMMAVKLVIDRGSFHLNKDIMDQAEQVMNDSEAFYLVFGRLSKEDGTNDCIFCISAFEWCA